MEQKEKTFTLSEIKEVITSYITGNLLEYEEDTDEYIRGLIKQFKRYDKKTSEKNYIARDKDGSLYLYRGMPNRNTSIQQWEPMFANGTLNVDNYKIFVDLAKNLKWEDAPLEVNVKIANNIA